MDKQTMLRNAHDWTNSKLAYCDALLKMLAHADLQSDIQQRVIQDSFLLHLYGVRDAFLQEINIGFEVGLTARAAKSRKLEEKLGLKFSGLIELNELEKTAGSWLHSLAQLRHIATHMSNVPRTFEGRSTAIRYPAASTVAPDVKIMFPEWLDQMSAHVQKWRSDSNGALIVGSP